jgi:hypothetical protein
VEVLPSASVYLYAYASSKVVDGDMRYRRYSMGMWSKGSRHPQACAYLGRPASERNPVAPRACSSRIRGYGRACLSSVVSSRGDCADCGGKSNTTRLEPRYATDLGVAGS